MTASGGPGEPDDRQLLAAHLTGDPDAFGTIVRRHRDRLWAVALRTTGDREEAADALQDALLSALRAAQNFRGDAAVSTWLHRIVVNACLDRLRRQAARPAVPLDDGVRLPVPVRDPTSTTGARIDLRAALAALPEAQRVAVVLVDVEGLPVAEVAELLGVAEGTVKSRCARGRLAMVRALGDGYRGDGYRDEGHREGPPTPARRSGRRSAGNPTPAGGVQAGGFGSAAGSDRDGISGFGDSGEEVSR